MVSFHRLSSSSPTHTSENTHPKRKSSSTLHLKNPSTSSPVRLPSLFKPILDGDAQNHPLTHGPLSHASHSAYPSLVLVLCRPIPILILTDPPPSTHPSFEPTHTFKSSFMDWKVIAKHRSEPCHLILVAAEAHRQRQTQIGALTRFQRLSIYHSLSLNLSLFLPPPPCLIEFESLMVLFWFLFLWKVYILQFSVINLFGNWENGWENVKNL